MKKQKEYRIKRIDDYGRVNLPLLFRRNLDVICGMYIKMRFEDKKIIIEKLK